MKIAKNRVLAAYYFKGVFLLILIAPLLGAGQNKKDGLSKKLSIDAAQLANEAYNYSKMGYFSNKLSLLEKNVDSALSCIAASISAIDSAILMASDSELMAINLANLSKKEAVRAQKYFTSCKNNPVITQKQKLLQEGTLQAGHATTDAYHASFYFKDGKPKEKAKSEVVVKDTIPKQITKLDIDQALFALLDKQLIEKEEKNKKDIAKLEALLKTAKDSSKKNFLRAEISKLEKNEAEVEKKDEEAKEKLGKINIQIDEREKNKTKETQNAENAFSKSLKRPTDEWNSQVLLDSEMPMGLVYQVQIGVYKNAVTPETFKGITPIFGKTTSVGVTYSVGIFEKASDATQAKDYVLSMGLHDAFVVAYRDKKRITLTEAAKLEKK